MKIILSRKGFDNQYGKQPSPILPDGTLLSLPIPMRGERTSFSQLYHNSTSYIDIIKSLKPSTHLSENDTCHLDPDIRKDAIDRGESWIPLFGQADSALSHLINNSVSQNDLFLFFGTFREVDIIKGQLKYKKGSPALHVIYGYLQIKELHRDQDSIRDKFSHHPHASALLLKKKLNGIFEANDKLSFDSRQNGSGVLFFNRDLILTKEGLSKSKWNLPIQFRDAKITYHSTSSFKQDYFQSAAKGQEFIISDSKYAEEWAKNLIKKGTKPNRVEGG
ncbi:Nmad3 family putative nucleotide modification protein [Nafulsella turpanensis]|uniref:Nmad3 family putative nucleotide modification protein n=1 Tax=Nafulsella turpanensis TaxID=1265690 RepID=UPI00034CCBCE|nr:hypothetical protein [Nafulsella turpanensis]